MRRCLILYGLTCIVGQVLSLRELATSFHGNELVYGAALAVWLLLFAVGSGVLGRLAAGHSLGLRAFVLALAGGGALVPVTVLLARSLRYVLFESQGVTPSLGGVLLTTVIVLAPLCLLLGFFYALACSMASRLEGSAASASARVYLFEAAGAFLGGVLLTYVLVFVLDALQIALLVAAVDCLAAFVVWRNSPRAGASSPATGARHWGWALLLCCAAFVATAFSPAEKVIDFLTLIPRYPRHMLLSSVDTPYGRVDVAEANGQREFYQSGSVVGTSPMDRSAEETAFLAVLSHPAPSRALVIGGAANGVFRKALEFPWLRVDDVELDPELVAAARRFGDAGDRDALASPRARVLADADGRFFIKRARDSYDVILSAAPYPNTGLINRFYTVEFFAEARRALKKDGVLALSLEGPPAYMTAPQRALAAGIRASLQRAFLPSGAVAVFPSDNCIYFFASPRAGSFAGAAAAWPSRMRQWGIRPAWLTESAVTEVALPAHAASLVATLRQVRPVSLNTDMRPAAYYQALLVWAEEFQISGTKLLQWAVRLNLWGVVLFVAAATGILSLAATFAQRPIRIALPATRVYVGMAGIVLEMVLIFAFQSIYGYVYSRLGILFAAFMMGTAAGALFSARKLAPRADLGTLAVCQLALAVLAAASVPILSRLAASGGWTSLAGATVELPLLNLCVGALVGVQYPVSVALGEMSGGDESRPGAVAAGLYALELAGACAGALLAGAVLIPVLGIPGACWAVSALSLAGLPLLLLSGRRFQGDGLGGVGGA